MVRPFLTPSRGKHEESQSLRTYVRDSSLKRLGLAREDSPAQPEVQRLERKLDRLEDLLWRLYEELDCKIQEVFDEHTARFKQQNEIVSSIFHGLGGEIESVRRDVRE